MRVDGYVGVKPVIKKITFVQKDKFDLHLKDGRIISVPFSKFPDVKKLTTEQRKQWYILDDCGFSFDDCDEVYHLEQVLGKFDDYKYSFLPEYPEALPNTVVNEPELKYRSIKSKKQE